MRLSFTQRPMAPQSLGSSFVTLAALGSSLSHAFEFEPAPPANLDFSNLGRIGIAGDFSGISLYEYVDQTGRPSGTNGSESILGMLPNGAFASIVSTDATIRTMCTFTRKNGDMGGVVIGGNFTSIDGTKSTAVALYNPDKHDITPLEGLQGEVNAVYCDEERDTVYVGGNFKTAIDSTNAIAWYADDGWTNLPFAGFNGPVEAITKAANGNIIFGGSFTGLGNASAPREPDGQIINLSTANIIATNSAPNSDPKGVACSAGAEQSAWMVQDNTPGFWDAEFGFGFEPTKLRLWNTHQDGRGTKTFRYLAFPINGIMNFTYVDQATGENKTCTSECPLSNDPRVKYQDFYFVNKVGMNRFQISISEWYGAGAGLAGIELFQDNIYSYAIESFNEPLCLGIDFPSTATATGPWKESPSLQSTSKYLTTELGQGVDSTSASVTFVPNIRESGNYSVNMYTPGCQPDGTCGSRGRVNVTATMSSGPKGADFSTILYQTNNYDKYDQIYFGYIEKTSDNFKPSVTISFLSDEGMDSQIMVAQRVGFTLINSTGGLNGLFEFDPEKAVVDSSDFEASAINQLGAGFAQNTGVKAMVTSGDVTFIGGNFTSDDHVNIVAIDKNEDVRRLDGGLNGPVLDMYIDGTKLYVGGEFNNTLSGSVPGMEHIAVYDVDADTWSPLGAGVNGRVQYTVPLQINITNTLETGIAFTGSFSQCNTFGSFESFPVNGFAIWVPSQDNWLQNLDGPIPSYSGVLTAALMDLPNGEAIYGGSISSAHMGVTGAATLNDEGLGNFPLKISVRASVSGLRRRDQFPDDDTSGVVTGKFYEEDDRNLTILAGRFTTQSKDGSAINNLVIIDGKDEDTVSGLADGLLADSTFVTLDVSGSTLFAGGKINGTIGDNDVSGIIAYDLELKSFGQQPSPISGGNGTVNVISVRPDTSDVFVGGSFTRAGALDCPGICLYDASSAQWIRPGSDVGGNVNCMLWSSKKQLVVGGALINGTGQTPLAIYNPDKESWEGYPGAEKVPGPVHAMTPASNDNKQIWVAGTSSEDDSIFLMKYDGDEWFTVKHELSSDSVIRSLQVFSITEDHAGTDIIDKKQVLMLTGSLGLRNFGMASAAIFNGMTFQPYALTTSTGNKSGSIAKIFSQKENYFTMDDGHLALVFVILIGLAISLALILVLVVSGIILERVRKWREGYAPAPTSMYDRGSGMKRIPPHELLEGLGHRHTGAPQV